MSALGVLTEADLKADPTFSVVGTAGVRYIPLGLPKVCRPKDREVLAAEYLFAANNLAATATQFAIVPQATLVVHPASMGATITSDQRLLDFTCRKPLLARQDCPISKTDSGYQLRPTETVQDLQGEYVCVLSERYFAYYHWLTEVLTGLHSARQLFPEHVRFLLPEPSGAEYRFDLAVLHDSLSLLGIDMSRIKLLPRGRYRVSRLAVPQTRDHFDFAAFEIIKSSVGPPVSRRYPKRLFISRADTIQRQIMNEDALDETLRRFAIERVVLSEYSFDDQVSMFSGVELVVAPHGAGLTNLVFAPRSTIVIEAIPRTDLRPWFWHLAAALGLDYYALLCESAPDCADMNIDLEHLAATLETVCK